MSFLRFKTKREMDQCAAVLIGKGKKVTPVSPSSPRHMASQPWAIEVEPSVRWSSQRKYVFQLQAFDDAVNKTYSINVHPNDLTEDELEHIALKYWLCECPKVRKQSNDRCFSCGDKYPENFHGNPNVTNMRIHLLQQKENEIASS